MPQGLPLEQKTQEIEQLYASHQPTLRCKLLTYFLLTRLCITMQSQAEVARHITTTTITTIPKGPILLLPPNNKDVPPCTPEHHTTFWQSVSLYASAWPS